MQTATTEQIKTMATICSKLRIAKPDIEVMVAGFSGGRETSRTKLYVTEAAEMIKHLLSLQGLTQIQKPGDKMVAKILAYCHELAAIYPKEGWTKKNKAGKTVANTQRFDQWAVEYSYLKKKLNQYKYAELPKLVSQFEMVYKAQLNKF